MSMINIDLPVSGKLHKFLKDAILERKRLSDRKMADYRCQWDRADDAFKAYIPTKDADQLKKDKKKYGGELDYITLEVPYTYGIVMTIHMYLASVFLARTPVYQAGARHAESQDSVFALEALLDYQYRAGKHGPVLYNWIFDMCKYNLGVVGTYWDNEIILSSEIVEAPSTVFGIALGKTKKQRVVKEVPGFSGNRLFNVRVHDFLPDPRKPISKFQEGEFCGRFTTLGWHELLTGPYINLKELKQQNLDKMSKGYQDSGSPRIDLPMRANEGESDKLPSYVDVLEMYVKVIPKLWGLGEETRPEIWVFTLANEEIIIGARPLGCLHNQFPFSILEGALGHSEFVKLGTVEIMRPLADVISWLFNSHFYNVRKNLNDTRVVDPSRVVMKDVTKGVMGGIWRLKPEAYGSDPRLAVHQFQHVDVTRSHITDAMAVENMMQKILGVMDTVMGAVDAGGRKTATEVRQSSGFSVNRIKSVAEYNSGLGFDPLFTQLVKNSQQYYDDDKKFRAAGNLLSSAGRLLDITPESIAGFYDFVPVDGTLPVDRIAQATFWKEMIMQLATSPYAPFWDVNEMIAHTMELQGERNIQRFKVQMQSPEQLMAQQQAGNVIPLGGRSGGKQGPSAQGPTGGALAAQAAAGAPRV